MQLRRSNAFWMVTIQRVHYLPTCPKRLSVLTLIGSCIFSASEVPHAGSLLMPNLFYSIDALCIKYKEDFSPAEQFDRELTWDSPFQSIPFLLGHGPSVPLFKG